MLEPMRTRDSHAWCSAIPTGMGPGTPYEARRACRPHQQGKRRTALYIVGAPLSRSWMRSMIIHTGYGSAACAFVGESFLREPVLAWGGSDQPFKDRAEMSLVRKTANETNLRECHRMIVQKCLGIVDPCKHHIVVGGHRH